MNLNLLNLLKLVSKHTFRIILVQIIALQILMAHTSNSQSIHDYYISIDVEDVTVQQLFGHIEKNSSYVFAFSENININKNQFSFNYNKVSIFHLLKEVVEPASLSFRQINNTIYVKRVESEIKEEIKPLEKEKLVLETHEISGTVVDASTSESLPGVSIILKGTTIGTITDSNGYYSIQIPDEPTTIIISYIGYKKQEISIVNEGVIDIQLHVDIQSLSEVIIVGYTSQQRKDLTGAISVIDMSKVENYAVTGLDQLIQGQTSGVQVTNDGAPGASSSVRIRGYGSIGNNDPLYVIDGVPTKSNLNLINPNDIESIQVLKDAAAASIYGSRAANGVVIVTTKKGKYNQNKITFDSYVGVQEVTNLPRMVNTEDWGELLFAAQINDGIIPNNQVYGLGPDPVIPDLLTPGLTTGVPGVPSVPGTDWFDELFNPAKVQYYNLGFQGGSDNLKSALSLSVYDQEGAIKYTDFRRYSVRINTEYKSENELIRMGKNLAYSYSSQRTVTSNRALGSSYVNALRMHPIVPIYDINGDFFSGIDGVRGADNPLALNFYNNRDDQRLRNKIFGNIFLEIQPVKNLKFKTDFGLDYSLRTVKNINYAFIAGDAQRDETFLGRGQTNEINWIWNNTIQYTYGVGDHLIKAIVGTESIKFDFESFDTSRSNFFTDEEDFLLLSSGEGQIQNSESATQWSLYSYFGQLDYDFKNKYLFTTTLRRDGSSRFGLSNRFAIFPAFSAGWRISSESFMSSFSFISDLKLRASWGENGNQEIGDFPTFSTFSTNSNNTNFDINGSNNSVITGFTATRIGNPDVKWEETTQTNIGLDATMLDDRLTATIDYFIKRTNDILLQPPTSAALGQATEPFVNLGEMQNKGLEVQLGYLSPSYGKFSFELNGNFSIIRNKVLKLDNSIEFLSGLDDNTFSRNLSISRTQVGNPIALFYGHIVDGIFESQEAVDAHADQPGKAIGRQIFRDINQDGVVNQDDRDFIGNPHPDFIYGFTLSAKYGNFDLSAFFQGVQGVDLFNFTRYYTDFFSDTRIGKNTRVLDAWTPQNTDATVPQLSTVDTNNELRSSSYFVEDGSFLRLKNLQIGYNVPASKFGFERVRVYIQAQNLLTFTDYEGTDPEVSLVNNSSSRRNLDIGVDRGIYPNARTISVGVNLAF